MKAKVLLVRHDFFWRRLSVVGLARKHGKTVKQIEEMLRNAPKRGGARDERQKMD
jgi:hypothetical protein